MSNDTPRPERVTLTDAEREALLSPESLRDEVAAALAGQAVRVQVVSVGTAVGFLRAESALHLADALLASTALAQLQARLDAIATYAGHPGNWGTGDARGRLIHDLATGAIDPTSRE